MNLKPGLKTLVIVCALGAIGLWGVILNTQILLLRKYWFLLILFYWIGNGCLFAIGEKYAHLTATARFLIIGILNTLVDLGALSFFLFFNPAKTIGWYYVLFKSLSFIFALANSYYFNSHFSFADAHKTAVAEQLSKFLLVSLVSFAINVNLASLINRFNFLSLNKGLWGVVAALVASVFGIIINFIGYRFWVFKKEKSSLTPVAKF
ncbi:MAG TPA: GtrA family protein [Candidatus Paceibacterota bacterium]|nr:GtrA family protein [Candidatus Paceibacterota bacterium]